jgi:transposase
MYYTGIDIHKFTSYLTTVESSGNIVKEANIKNVDHNFVQYFSDLASENIATVESTMNWYWLNDLLKDNGIELVLVHAKYLKAIIYIKDNTDKVDSQTLAMLLRQNFVPCAHKISRELRGLRDTMRIRLRLVQQRTACLLRHNSIQAKFNGSIPDPYRFQVAVLEHTRDTFTEPDPCFGKISPSGPDPQ